MQDFGLRLKWIGDKNAVEEQLHVRRDQSAFKITFSRFSDWHS